MFHNILLSILYFFFATRVITRNNDWRNEFNLFSSALKVCPESLKVLSNYALLAMDDSKTLNSALEAGLKALKLHPLQHAALMNVGIIFFKLGDHANSVFYFEKSLEIKKKYGKAYGYIGFF
jgi:tetratricopeptide (TPR) repeat protein